MECPSSVIRRKNKNRTSGILYKISSISSVITLLPNLNFCPSLPTKWKKPSYIKVSKACLQGMEWQLSEYILFMNIKNVSFLKIFLLWLLTRNLVRLLTTQSIHLQTNLQRKETYAKKIGIIVQTVIYSKIWKYLNTDFSVPVSNLQQWRDKQDAIWQMSAFWCIKIQNSFLYLKIDLKFFCRVQLKRRVPPFIWSL